MNGFGHSSHQTRRRRFEPAPRISGPAESRLRQERPLILALLLAPMDVIFGLFARVFSLMSNVLPFVPRVLRRIAFRSSNAPIFPSPLSRSHLSPQASTSSFLRNFSSTYGQHTLPFVDTSYARAFDTAKADCKFLLVIPLSLEHNETDRFVRQTLLAPSTSNYFTDTSSNMILWAGSVADPECCQVAKALGIDSFPSSAVIAHTPSVSSNAMSIIARLGKFSSPSDFVATLEAAKSQHGDELDRARANRAEQQATRNLREQQNSAYERSLATDKERIRLRKEAEMEKARQERDEDQKQQQALQYARNLAQWKRWRAQSIRAEPETGSKNVVRINVRLLSGERVTRRFAADSRLEELYAFVECYDVVTKQDETTHDGIQPPKMFSYNYPFRLVSSMPREVYELRDGGTVQSRVGKSANLIAERLEDEDDDDANDEKQ